MNWQMFSVPQYLKAIITVIHPVGNIYIMGYNDEYWIVLHCYAGMWVMCVACTYVNNVKFPTVNPPQNTVCILADNRIQNDCWIEKFIVCEKFKNEILHL